MAKKPHKPGKSNESQKEIAGGKPDRASGGASTGQPNVVPPATGQRNPKEGQGRSEVF